MLKELTCSTILLSTSLLYSKDTIKSRPQIKSVLQYDHFSKQQALPYVTSNNSENNEYVNIHILTTPSHLASSLFSKEKRGFVIILKF